ncbi:BQ2448_3634 [Microbotryum intermedium]|uniref:BQ2448_3634 protein n=1 Tax=Microbotryum intermedium TaxID=269621 RepID=A0A238FAK0_9BASI|nr:BQ2448_3634 [Microbotryum intermedium]
MTHSSPIEEMLSPPALMHVPAEATKVSNMTGSKDSLARPPVSSGNATAQSADGQHMRHAVDDDSDDEDELAYSDWSPRMGVQSGASTAPSSPEQHSPIKPISTSAFPSQEQEQDHQETDSLPLALNTVQSFDELLPPRSTHRANTTNWAPTKQLPMLPETPLPQLPDFTGRDGMNLPTSLPIPASQVHMEMSDAINALISEEVFRRLMKDSLGRHRFREYLINTRGDVASFDLWIDLTGFRALTTRVRSTAIALHDLFVVDMSFSRRPVLTSELREDVEASLRQGMFLGDSLEAPQQHLLHSLYSSEFQSFIKYKLVEECHVRLGQTESLPGTGLGDAFCLTNPRLRDHPITLLSPGFERLTGYAISMVAGRNCRMLAGPATSPVTSKRIHDALSRGEGITTLILNYRRDGTPFFQLLCIIPLRDTYGHLTYFLGGQTEVTGSLAAGNSLSWLVGSDADPSEPLNDEEFSPTYLNHASALFTSGSHPEMDLVNPVARGSSSPDAGRAGGEIQPGRKHEGELDGTNQKKRGLGLKTWIKSFGTVKKKEQRSLGDPSSGEGQQIGGDEALFSKTAKPVELQLAQFASVYSKVVVFRRSTRQILFVTAEFLGFCGLPNSKPSQIFNSEFILQDILSIITAPQPGQDRTSTRQTLKSAILRGQACSLRVGVKGASRQGNEPAFVKYGGMLHISPLINRERVAEGFVGV